MTPELDKKLRERYPLVFPGPLMNDEPIRCGDGWFDLLDRLCQVLEREIAAAPERKRYGYRAVQVKEKFGYLRFYLEDTATSAMERAIKTAEDESVVTCDQCGQVGKRDVFDGLVATRCPAHAGWRDVFDGLKP